MKNVDYILFRDNEYDYLANVSRYDIGLRKGNFVQLKGCFKGALALEFNTEEEAKEFMFLLSNRTLEDNQFPFNMPVNIKEYCEKYFCDS